MSRVLVTSPEHSLTDSCDYPAFLAAGREVPDQDTEALEPPGPPPHILTFDPTGGNNKGESKDFLRVVDCSDDTFNLTLAPNFTILLTDVWNFLVEYRE